METVARDAATIRLIRHPVRIRDSTVANETTNSCWNSTPIKVEL